MAKVYGSGVVDVPIDNISFAKCYPEPNLRSLETAAGSHMGAMDHS
jgi:hypothetical protein